MDHRKSFLIYSIYLIFILYFIPSSFATVIVGSRIWSGPDETRIVFDLSNEVSYSILNEKSNKYQLSIRLKDSTLGDKQTTNHLVQDGIVNSIEFDVVGNDLNVIIKLSKETSYKVFTLPPIEQKPHRLVIDISNPGNDKESKNGQANEYNKKGVKTIVIDPGHGGEDPGAVGKGGTYEKDVVFNIAKLLETDLKSRGYRVYLTRRGDYFLTLKKRTALAQKYKGDLFISIHANSNPDASCRGTEVYFLSLKGASDKQAQLLANRENSADLIGGIAPESDEAIAPILMDLMRTETIKESSLLADITYQNLRKQKYTNVLANKQANFGVLKSLTIPSILVEVAFISNSNEEKLLKSSAFQQAISNKLADSIDEFFKRQSK